MKQYTLIYQDASGEIQTYDTLASSEDQAALEMERDSDMQGVEFELVHTVEHRVPKVTVVLNGDAVEQAYSDVEVELIHVYADKGGVERALEHEESLMPDRREEEHLEPKAPDALPFSVVPVNHDFDLATFDHEFAADPERVKAYTDAVRAET